MNAVTINELKDTTANPAPLGLFAFGMTTVFLNFHNAGLYEFNSMILAIGFFYGGIAQVVAGIMEWKKNNTFGMTAFLSYGFFWLALVAMMLMPRFGMGEQPSPAAMQVFLGMWGVFTLLMFIGTLRISRALQVVFGSLTLLYFLLVLGDATGNAAIKQFTGVEGLVCGFSAIYAGIAQVLNEVYGRTVLPLGMVKQ